MHKQINQTLRRLSYGGSYSKLELQAFLCRNFYCQRTCVTKPIFLTPIQPKIHASNSHFVPLGVNEYAKKNTTIFINHQGELLTTMSDYLLFI